MLQIAVSKNITSGLNCCQTIEVTGGEVTIANQWTRVGTFNLHSEHGGRAIYLQDNGQNYIYFLGGYIDGYNWWYINDVLGENMGGCINYDKNALCPDQISTVWDTYAWTGEWSAINDWFPDPELKIRCVSSEPTTTTKRTSTTTKSTTRGPEKESCTWGSFCEGCSVTSSVDGVTYCCATNCNSGGINVSQDADGIDCYCYH
jgi:hypothetical protein